MKAPIAAPPQRRARLAVVRMRFGNPPRIAIVAMGPNAGDRRTLRGSTRLVRAADPSWSPDGRKIYFTGALAERRGRQYFYDVTDLFELRADGRGLHRLTSFGDASTPVASPDGRWLLFARYEHLGRLPPASGLWVARADGTHARRVLPAREADYDLPGGWSPDGRSIVFTRCRYRTVPPPLAPQPCDIYRVSRGRPKPQLLATHAMAPAYSPDGTRIAFVSDRDRNGSLPSGEDESKYAGELYVMNADGSHPRRLTRTRELDEQHPVWSPDGSWLAYARGGPSILVAQVMRSRADGSCPTRIVGNAVVRTALTFDAPSWRPGRLLDRRSLRCGTG